MIETNRGHYVTPLRQAADMLGAITLTALASRTMLSEQYSAIAERTTGTSPRGKSGPLRNDLVSSRDKISETLHQMNDYLWHGGNAPNASI